MTNRIGVFPAVAREYAVVHDSAASLSKSHCRDHESIAIEGVIPEPAGRITFVG